MAETLGHFAQQRVSDQCTVEAAVQRSERAAARHGGDDSQLYRQILGDFPSVDRTRRQGHASSREDVKPGHWGQSIVFFTKVTKTEVDPITGEEEETSFPILKTYTVFNVDQVAGPSTICG